MAVAKQGLIEIFSIDNHAFSLNFPMFVVVFRQRTKRTCPSASIKYYREDDYIRGTLEAPGQREMYRRYSIMEDDTMFLPVWWPKPAYISRSTRRAVRIGFTTCCSERSFGASEKIAQQKVQAASFLVPYCPSKKGQGCRGAWCGK